jgi:outer membrane protein OmpA-like peptidoglycan-associated protein
MKVLASFNSKSLIISVLLIFSTHILRGQNPAASSRNLVVNPSFETRVLSDKGHHLESIMDTITEYLGWSFPLVFQPRIYGTTQDSVIYDETLIRGQRNFKAQTGTHVASMMTCCDGYRGVLEGELKEPIEVGSKYYVGFSIHYHCISTNGVGMAFEFRENFKKRNEIFNLQPVVYQKTLWDYDPQKIWLTLVDSFIADKPYKNFYIGNFWTADSTTTSKSKGFNHYLAFIDDVFVIKSTDSKMPPPKPKPMPPPPPLPKVLNQVQFEYNSAQIMANSLPQLDSAVLTLQRFPKLVVLIKGHTSSEGSAERNQKLSDSRAEAVKSYLVGKGIAAERLQTRGFGATQPLVVENTEVDKKLNRRIEFEVVKE